MTSKLDPFTTERLKVQSWRPTLEDDPARQNLETALAAILTPPVLAHLPPSLQLKCDISDWIDARAKESDVHLVERRDTRDLAGLLIVATDSNEGQAPILHVGYLLAEAYWGQGLATELVAGLVAATRRTGPLTLVGGVSDDNPASARVLEKAGFALSPELSNEQTKMYILTVE